MRSRLAEEFGPGYEITGTGHYLVVHPRDQGDHWADRFEDLYHSFVHYFSVRGLHVSEPRFPLVAIVFHNQQEYQSYAARHVAPVGANVLGYYSPMTNRVCLFDSAGGRGGRAASQQNIDTIIHEVTHQTAFNTGVHARFAGCPRWLAEGLAMLFEARGVHSSTQYPNQADRVNRGRLAEFRQFRRGDSHRDISPSWSRRTSRFSVMWPEPTPSRGRSRFIWSKRSRSDTRTIWR